MIFSNARFYFVSLMFAVFYTLPVAAQEFNPQPLLDSIRVNLAGVKDYTADINIKVNVSFLKIPVKQGKLYFKHPDKVKLVSQGFAMLPKRGMNFTLNELFDKKYNVIYVKDEIIKKVKSDVIKIIPMDDNADILLATLWIDRQSKKILKIDAVSKTNGKFVTHFDYPAKPNPFGLPSQLTFTFEVTQANLPMGVTGNFDADTKLKNKDNKPQQATLTIGYSNYAVNKGIADSFFNDEPSKSRK